MRFFAAAGSAMVLGLLLAGCQTSDQGRGVRQGASVTRFHQEQPIARGEIAIAPFDSAQADSLEFAQLAASVERELVRLGWRVTRDRENSEQTALIRVEQGSRAAMGSRSGVSIGIGGGTGGYRSGVGVGVGATIPVGSRSSNEIVVTELSVRIQRRSDGGVFWEGRAELEARANSPLAGRAAAVDRLAEALFRDFPGASGQTLVVR